MILTEKLLKDNKACEEGIAFCKRNKLYGFDLDRIHEVIYDFSECINWIKWNIIDCELRYDERDNLIYKAYKNHVNTVYTYDDRNNLIRKDNSNYGYVNYTYDSDNRLIEVHSSDGGFSSLEVMC